MAVLFNSVVPRRGCAGLFFHARVGRAASGRSASRVGHPCRTAARRSCRRKAWGRGRRSARVTRAAARTTPAPKAPRRGAPHRARRSRAPAPGREERRQGRRSRPQGRGTAHRRATTGTPPAPRLPRSAPRRPAARGSGATPPTATAPRSDGEGRSRSAAQPEPQGAAREEEPGEPDRRSGRHPRRGAGGAAAGGRAAPRPGRAKRQRTERSEGSTPAKPRSDAGRGAAPRRGTGDAAEGGAETGANVRRIPLKSRSAGGECRRERDTATEDGRPASGAGHPMTAPQYAGAVAFPKVAISIAKGVKTDNPCKNQLEKVLLPLYLI